MDHFKVLQSDLIPTRSRKPDLIDILMDFIIFSSVDFLNESESLQSPHRIASHCLANPSMVPHYR